MNAIKSRLDPKQFGSLKGSSTVDALISMFHCWFSNTDGNSNSIRVFLLDFSKAFDRINHKILVNKMLLFWHLDGNHKIIRWGFVIHGCVDGYSRRVMFLRASTNNKANTVFTLFTEAVEKFGLPHRVRGDQGTENIDVTWFMFLNSLRGPGRGSYIAGKSCHNQRIERFWRDLFHGCTFIFYYVFWYLEENAYLDISNNIHLFSLHYIFLPRINRHLGLFQEGYDNHPLGSESNMTPIQLWVSGVMNTSTLNDLEQSNVSAYGIDFEGPLPSARYNGET